MKVTELLALISVAFTLPVATSIAAISEAVPWRTYSNSRRAGRPDRTGWVGCLRLLVRVAVFSSMDSTTAFFGGFK